MPEEARKVLINIHSSENRAPSGSVLNYGEIAVSHSSKQNAALYTKISDEEVAKFISEDEVNSRISGYTDEKYNELAGIVQDLANLTITDIQAESPISATPKAIVVESCGNTVTISHVADKTAQSGFTKLSTDTYGHVTAGTAVEIGDISGLTGFQEAVREVETKLSTGSTSGDGNAVTDIQINDHEITLVKGEKFALSGHTHDASEIVSGVLDIARIPTAPVSSTASGTVATGEQVQSAIDNALTSSMNYKGATSTLPSSAKTGDFYIADAEIAISAAESAKGVAATAETGDYIIARTGGDSATWDVVEKNLDGAVTSTGMTNEEIVVADGDGRAIKSVAATNIKVGSAFTADEVDLSGVQNADDLKAIEALSGTTGVLNKTAANTWELVNVVDTISDFSGLTASGSLVDAKVVKDVIVQNERVTSAALNDLNDRINELSGGSASDITELSGSVITLSASTVGIENDLETLSGAVESLTFTQYASAITINGTQHDVVNNGVDLGNYLSASTAHITTIQQTETASAVTTTINYVTDAGTASAATIVQDIVIDCGTY